MSRHLLVFLLSELKTVRIICKTSKCGAVIEVPVEKLSYGTFTGRCHVCDEEFVPADANKNPFHLLADAIKRFRAVEKRLDVEFVLAGE